MTARRAAAPAPLVVLLGLAVPGAALANGYSVPNVNPRDLGLAGSAIASQRDAAAVYGNPAALARLPEGLQLAVGASLVDIHQDWRAPVGPATAATRLRLAPPAEAFAAWSTTIAGTRAGFGAGFNVPFGGDVHWADDWQGRLRVTTVDRRVYAFYANGAAQVLPWLRVGGGLVYYHATEYLRQGMDFLTSEGYAEVSTRGGAPAYDVSFELEPAEAIRVGLDYKHKATLDLTGDAAFHGVPASLRPSLPDQRVTHQVTIPNVAQAAVMWQARRDLQLNAAFSFDRYHVYQVDVFAGSAGTQVVVPHHYGNGQTYRLGVEYALAPAFELRAGVLRDVSGMSQAHYSPALPDASCWAGTLGASWRLEPALTVDAGFFWARMDRVHDETGSAPGGSYAIRAWVAALGVTWRPARR